MDVTKCASILLLLSTVNAASAAELSSAPGTQVLIVDHGRTVYAKSAGVRDLTSRIPIDDRTRFEIGSITKQFTAAAILQLKERGRLSLTDPLGKYVPQYAQGKKIPLEDLLWQVSGIPDYIEEPGFWKLIERRGYRAVFAKRLDLAGVLALIKDRPLRFQTGSRWEYSNTNYYLLGEVVSAASGMPYERYVRENIFGPAGMTESTFASDESGATNIATGYGIARDTHKPIPTGPDVSGRGDGAIVTTANDLAKWDAALLTGKIVVPNDFALMVTPAPTSSHRDAGYGFGLQIDRYDDAVRYQHNGRSIGFAATNQVYPALSQFVIVLANANYVDTSEIADGAFDRYNPTLAAKQNFPARGEDRALTTRVKTLWNGIMTGKLDRRILSPEMSSFMTAGRMASTRQDYANRGSVTRWIYRGETWSADGGLYTYRLTFKAGAALLMTVEVTPSGKIDALTFKS